MISIPKRDSRQILTQQDLKDRGVRFYFASDGTALGVVDVPLSASDQQQMTAFMKANNALSYAVLLAEDTLAHSTEKQGVSQHA